MTKTTYPYLVIFDDGRGLIVESPERVTWVGEADVAFVAGMTGMTLKSERSAVRQAYRTSARRQANADGTVSLTAEEGALVL